MCTLCTMEATTTTLFRLNPAYMRHREMTVNSTVDGSIPDRGNELFYNLTIVTRQSAALSSITQ